MVIKKVEHKKLAFIFLLLVFSLSLVFASHIILPTSLTIVEDSSNSLFNISINNTDLTNVTNISQVDIIIPATFTFVSSTNGTEAGAHTFSNTSTVLTWSNDGLVMNETLRYFWFNASASTPGTYNLTINTTNSTGIFVSNVTVTVNDTTSPATIDFASPTESDNSNLSVDYIEVNVSATDNGVIDTILLFLYNSSNMLVSSGGSSGDFNYTNFSGLSDDIYYFNATVNDTFGNSNSTFTTRTVTVDTTNPLVAYDSGTLADNSNITDLFIYSNVTVTETNEINITFELYNSTALVNSTTYTDSRREINWTSLPDEAYSYNITVYDYASNSNITSTRTLTIDTTNPLVAYDVGLEVDNANVSNSFVYINSTVTETNEINITFELYNSTSLVNSTTYTDSRREINWTSLAEGSYEYNITVYDYTSNSNTTSTRSINLDNSNPVVTLIAPANATSATTTAYNFTFNVSDTLDISNCTLNFNGSVINTLFNPAKDQTLGMYNSSLSVGSHNWSVSCTDSLNNTGTSTVRYLTVSAAVPASSSSSSGSSGPGGYPTYRPSVDSLSTGYSATLGKNYKINFKSGGEDHVLNMDSVSLDKVVITISSDPVTLEILEGATKKVDIDHDGVYDLSVFIEDILINRAEIIITSINEIVEENLPSDGSQEAIKDVPATGNVAGDGDRLVEEKKSFVAIYFVIAILILAIIAGYFMRTRFFKKLKR